MGGRDERAQRVADAARRAGADWALLTSPELVCYASGHEVPIELGPSPHAGGPAVAMVALDGAVALVVEDLQEDGARASRAERVVTVPGFAPLPHRSSLEAMHAAAVAGLLDDIGVAGSVVGVEPATLPLALARVLDAAGVRTVDVTPELRRARATKTRAELAQLRACAELTAVGQRAALDAARPGISELELFARAREAMEAAAGRTLAVGVDLLSGVARTAEAMGPPGGRCLEEGDPVLCDLGPRLDGYWGDSCNTFVVGERAPAGYTALRAVAARALERAAEVLRPGLLAGELDAEVRAVIEAAGYRDPLHVGHAIGTANFEHPRIVPGEEALLEPDMVLMIEPGVYAPGEGGARLEWMFRVTEEGNEIMSPYEHVATSARVAT